MMQMKIPLHLSAIPSRFDAMERLCLHADMSSLNPKGFRTASMKKNRKREKTRVEKFSMLIEDN